MLIHGRFLVQNFENFSKNIIFTKINKMAIIQHRDLEQKLNITMLDGSHYQKMAAMTDSTI